MALGIGLLVVSAPAWLDTAPDIPPRSVGDQAFTEAADAVCARTLPPLRRDRPESRDDTGTPTAFAGRIDRAADGLAGITAQLRALPVAAADAARIDGWLDDWEAYAGIGHRYADSLRAEDNDLSRQLEAQGSTVSTRIFVFAKANGMSSCTF